MQAGRAASQAAIITAVYIISASLPQHIMDNSTASITKRLVASCVSISTAEYLATIFRAISVVRSTAIN